MKRQGEPLPLEVQQLLAPFFPGFDLSRVRIFEGIPRYVSITAAADPIGYTDGWRIYLAPGYYRVDSLDGLALIAHELVHSRQYHEFGKWNFRARYLSAYAQNLRQGMTRKAAYEQIPFEIEAREVERQVFSALLQIQSNFTIE
ncbi:MAG TPA: DUF4157 domain-containing protein [Blastocatellia bacterium]|nr:DUF4157 domain-containing protein [Blastocatellia bacterium]